MSGYEVAPGSESIRIFPQGGMDGTHVMQPWGMEWAIRETCISHRSVLTLTRLALPVVTEQALSPPSTRRRRGLLGGADGGRRNGDHIMVGMKVRKLTRDVRVRGLSVRTYTITGVDRVQDFAFDVMDEVGHFLKTDLHPDKQRLPEEELVRHGQWQAVPGHHYLEASRP